MVKILYIEDNEDNIYVVSRRLQRKGYEVLIARDGAEGLAQAKSRAPALILVDLGLPVIDGWAGCNDFIAKPVDFPRLINRIEVLLRTKSKT